MFADGTPAEVRDNLRRLADGSAPGGGFVFQPVHHILADVPPENVAAMFDAVRAGGIRPARRSAHPSRRAARIRAVMDWAVSAAETARRQTPGGACHAPRADCFA
ncbi:MAG: hypothetical protein GXY25_16220 [Pirellulaceae bacterium]|nr:hypothetical protein [Pirellulaceae bacterium]